jgi:hypothetical protein
MTADGQGCFIIVAGNGQPIAFFGMRFPRASVRGLC